MGGEVGESKGERAIRPVIKSRSALHSLEHSERFTELCKEEKRRGRKEIEVTWRRRESQKGREQSGQ